MIWLWIILGIVGYYLGWIITAILSYKLLNFDKEESVFFSVFWPVTILFIPVGLVFKIINNL